MLLSGACESLLQAVGLLAIFGLAYTIYRWYTVRSMFRRLVAQGLPVPPHSFIWGHIKFLWKLPGQVPPDAHSHYLQSRLVQNWKHALPNSKECPHVWYIDLWPLTYPMVCVTDPKIATQYYHVPKDQSLKNFIHPLTAHRDLLTSDGTFWRQWRARFNPGFSARNLLSLVPMIMEQVLRFRGVLRLRARGSKWGPVFQMEPLTTNLTFDVIGRVALDTELDEQNGTKDGELKRALCESINLLVFHINLYTFWKAINPVRNFKLWRNNRIMRRWLVPRIMAQVEESSGSSTSGAKTVLELAVKNVKEEGGQKLLDNAFIETVLAQLKIFMLAGHDTTATSLCWLFYELEKNPRALAKMRDEHDRVFGPDPAAAELLLQANPALINSLPYTLGVVKEGLRLHPNIGSLRQGSKALSLTGVSGHEGVVFPTEGLVIWDSVLGMHMRPDLWVRATEFLPERWTATDECDPLHPPKNAWRPFGIGQRNCIGQELAMLEMKLVLVLVCRELDVASAFEEWDELSGAKGKPEAINGHRLYQINGSTPHTKDGAPSRVRLTA